MIARVFFSKVSALALALAPVFAQAAGQAPLIQPRELAPGAAAANLGWSGVSPSVEGTGRQGVDGNTFFVYQAPATVAEAVNQTLRVQRSASYPNSSGSVSGTAQAIWGLDFTSPTGSLYEWAITGQLYNQTGASLGSGAQNVAVNGTAFKQFKPGYNYGSDQISPTWGGNFVCNDLTGTVNPTSACIGVEIDNYFQSGVGTDANANRVVLQLAWGAGGAPETLGTDHIGAGILFGGNGAATMDNALKFGGGGAYGIGLNFSGATFNTAPVFLGQGQKLVFDGTTAGTYNWALSDVFGTMALQYDGVNALTVDASGNVNAPGNLVSSANITANGAIRGATVQASTFNLGGGWTASNISGTVALQYGGANKLTVDGSGNVVATGSLSTSANIIANGVLKTGGYTVTTLNAIAAPAIGMRAYVTDATSCALNGALAGGGSVKCPVWYNGTAWVGG